MEPLADAVDAVPRRWAVRYSGGPLIGPAWLLFDGQTLELEPRAGQPNPRVPPPPALPGRTPHHGANIVAFHARALPAQMNGSILFNSAERTYVVYIPWFNIHSYLLPALTSAGVSVSVRHTWVGLGRQTAAKVGPTEP
jgi:hypothetical protein